MSIVKRCLIFGVSIYFIIYFFILGLETVKVDNTYKLVYGYADICADGAIQSFQDESNMDLYKAPGTTWMSNSYRDYVNWLGGYPAYRDISSMLMSRFNEGITAGNFALPYLDKEKVNDTFKSYLRKQINIFNQHTGKSTGFVSAKNIDTQVTSFVLEMRDFNTEGKMFGANSNFSSNTSGHTMLYNYTNYPSYFVEFEVTYTVPTLSKLTKLALGDREYKFKIYKTYELFN